MPIYSNTSSSLRHRIRTAIRLCATSLLLLLGVAVTRAENPWTSSETARGGTFDDGSIDPVMLKAGNIAEQRALPHSTMRCWRFVKEALVAAGSVSSYPQTTYAKQAGDELVHTYGFVRLAVRCAAQAPVGSVIVYGGKGPGHVELRTASGFVSDFYHRSPSNMPFIGAYTRVEKRKPIQTVQANAMENIDS
jgi:hypothetical protein